MCRQCARGGCASLKMGTHPLIARLRQHVDPNYSQLGFRVHPPNPPQGGLSCSLLPFAVRHINNHIAQPSTADVDGCRVVGLPNKQVRAARSAKTTGQAAQGGRAGADQARNWPQLSPAWGPRPLGGTRPDPQKSTDHAKRWWVWSSSLWPNGKEVIRGAASLQSGGFTLPHRSDGTLGRGPRSEPRAPMQMFSNALGSLGFRVVFRV